MGGRLRNTRVKYLEEYTNMDMSLYDICEINKTNELFL